MNFARSRAALDTADAMKTEISRASSSVSHSAEELIWSIRYGVGRGRRALVMMPAQYLRKLGDRDLETVVKLREAAIIDLAVEPDK